MTHALAEQLDLVELPTGIFTMGATEQDKFANLLERPAHEVTISHRVAFGRYPVTRAQWAAYADDVGDAAPQPAPLPDRPPAGSQCDRDHVAELPMLGVSWDDAVAYCRWLRERTDKPYRLPSEAEWEYGCRAGSHDVFSTGSTIDTSQANYLYDEFGREVGLGRPTTVGHYPPNAFGLCDMHGNVADLVLDHWHDGYHHAPTDGTPWVEPAHLDDGYRVLRGGSWDYLPRLLRCAYRDWVHRSRRLDNVGLRLALDLDSTIRDGGQI